MPHDYSHAETNDLLLTWRDESKRLKEIRARESAMRAEIVRRMFPNIKEGTQRVPLGNSGFQLKAVNKPNYRLEQNETKIADAIQAIQSAGNEGPFIRTRLIKNKPELSVSEYKDLVRRASEGDGVARACLTAIQSVLTITPGSTELEIEEPA